MCVLSHAFLAISGTGIVSLEKPLLQLPVTTSVVKQSKKHPFNAGECGFALLQAFLPKTAGRPQEPALCSQHYS